MAESHVVQAGQLRHVLELQSQSTDLDDNNENANTWSKVANGDVRCRTRRISGDESVSQKGQMASSVHEIMCRYRPDITERHRFVKPDGTILDIQEIDNVSDRNTKLIIKVKQISITGNTGS